MRVKVWVDANIVMYVLLSSTLIITGRVTKRRRCKLLGLASEDEMSERAGIEVELLRNTLRGHGIHPRCMVDGRLLYDPADLGDAAILLRPAHNADLLRPAAGAASEPDTLLRSSQGQEE